MSVVLSVGHASSPVPMLLSTSASLPIMPSHDLASANLVVPVANAFAVPSTFGSATAPLTRAPRVFPPQVQKAMEGTSRSSSRGTTPRAPMTPARSVMPASPCFGSLTPQLSSVLPPSVIASGCGVQVTLSSPVCVAPTPVLLAVPIPNVKAPIIPQAPFLSSPRRQFSAGSPTQSRYEVLTKDMPHPDEIEKQRQAVAKSLAANLQKASQEIAEQVQAEKQEAAQRAVLDKRYFDNQIDQLVQEKALEFDAQTNFHIMALQQAAVSEKTRVEEKAVEVKMDYEFKKAQEEMLARQFEIEHQFSELVAPLRHAGQEMQSTMAKHGMIQGRHRVASPPPMIRPIEASVSTASPPPRIRPIQASVSVPSGSNTPLHSRSKMDALTSMVPPATGTSTPLYPRTKIGASTPVVPLATGASTPCYARSKAGASTPRLLFGLNTPGTPAQRLLVGSPLAKTMPSCVASSPPRPQSPPSNTFGHRSPAREVLSHLELCPQFAKNAVAPGSSGCNVANVSARGFMHPVVLGGRLPTSQTTVPHV